MDTWRGRRENRISRKFNRLDEKQFESCLSTGKYKAQVEQDRQLGQLAGVSGTPGFLVNGKLVGNLRQDAFEKVIEAELAASTHQRTAP